MNRSPFNARVVERRSKRALRQLPVLAVLVLGACGILPSEPPKFEETYVVQAASLNLSAVDLAPDVVSVNADSSAFVISTEPVLFVRSLGQMCAACAAVHGTTVAKPAFTVTYSTTIPVSPQMIAASLAGGTIELGVANGLNFDPVRPSAAARGTIVMTVRRGTTSIATFTVNGTTTPFPPGSILGGVVPVSAFNYNQALTVDVTVTSPAGDAVAIDTARQIAAVAGPLTASVSEITVSVASQSFADTVPLDLTETKLDLDKKLESGAFRFNFTNPFAVGGTFSLKILEAGTTTVLLDKGVTLAQTATSANRIGLTKAEIGALLGKELTVIIAGSFNAPGGQLTLTPKQVANFTSLLEIIVFPLGA